MNLSFYLDFCTKKTKGPGIIQIQKFWRTVIPTYIKKKKVAKSTCFTFLIVGSDLKTTTCLRTSKICKKNLTWPFVHIFSNNNEILIKQ